MNNTQSSEKTSHKYSDIEQKYLDTLNDVEKQAFNIAREHLGSSFDLSKSIGYKKWEQENHPNVK